MLRRAALVASFVLVASLVAPAAAHDDLGVELPFARVESHDGGGTYSENMSLVANWDHDGTYRQGSDLAFWGDLAVLGNYDNPGGFRLLDVTRPEQPELVGQFVCPGSQADVSIFRELVFVSVDSTRSSSECGAGGASAAQTAAGEGWEGIRVVSIDDPAAPVQIAAVDTDCGSHTHTLVPDLDYRDPETGNHEPRVLIYVLSYPLGGQSGECNALTHRKISVVEVPLQAPESASVIATPDVSPAVGCHDVTVFPEEGIAAAACITESQIWDISDPAAPSVIAHIVNPAVNIHHSTTFSWDADTLVIGDELGGAAASPGCFTGGHAPLGALWFYDVSDPTSPEVLSFYQIPQQEVSAFCTAHNFNPIPLRDGRDILVSAWYNGGTTLLDFTDPSNPEQIAFAVPAEGGRAATWSSYWYKDHVFANNFDEDVNSLTAHSRGFDVFAVDDDRLASAVPIPHLNPQTQIRPPAMGAAWASAAG